MQMTEWLVTKAAASTARSQPAESRDRKYDKHLSYSATWGRSAGPAGSREGGGGGKNPTPRHGVHAACEAFGAGIPAGRGRQRPQPGHSPKPLCLRTRKWPTEMTEWQDGCSSWSRGTQNAACAQRSLRNTRNRSPNQQYFRSRTEPSCIFSGQLSNGADPAAGRLPWRSPHM